MSRILIAFVVLLVFCPALALVSAEESTFPVQHSWGRIVPKPKTVELQVKSMPNDRIIRIPRFNNPHKRVYLQTDTQEQPLELRPEVSEWLITLPRSTSIPATIIIETVSTPQLLTKPFVTAANKDGTFVLSAHHAVVHGELLRYEPQPHKNTVGYWANARDWCEWPIEVSEPGAYDVHILQGCGQGHGGSRVQISVGSSKLTFTVEDTGHFQNFKERHVGTLQLAEARRQALKVVPVNKAKGAVMDVRRIRLVLTADTKP